MKLISRKNGIDKVIEVNKDSSPEMRTSFIALIKKHVSRIRAEELQKNLKDMESISD